MNKGINRNRLADSTSIVAAIGASLCCIGPFVLIALGFGTLAGAVSAFFAPLRPYLLAVAFGIVGWRLVALYRGAEKAEVCSTEDGASCPSDGRRRDKTLTWGVLGLVAFLAASPYLIAFAPSGSTSNQSAVVAAAAVAGKGDICLAINGMTCSACAGHVERVISEVPGVSGVRVSYDQAEACIAANQPASVDRAALLAAVASAGYQAVEK